MAEEEEKPHRKSRAESRSCWVPVDDLDLKTVEGQDKMLERMQIIIASQPHNFLDLRAFALLKDTVKTKTDLNVLRLFTDMKKQMDEWKKEREKPQES